MKDNLYYISMGCAIASLFAYLIFFLKVVVDFIKESSPSLTIFYPL